MTAPVQTTCWSCSFCHQVFPDNQHGHRQALECCTCTDCRETTYVNYVGGRTLCRRCHAIRSHASAVKHLEDAQAGMAHAEAELAKYRKDPAP